MAKLNIKKLEQMDKADLISIILDTANQVAGVSDFINMNYLVSTDKKAKQLITVYKQLKRRSKFHDYYATIDFVKQMQHKIIDPATRLCAETPTQIVSLAQTILDDFEQLFEHKDDSSGCGMDLLYMTCELWGEAWRHVSHKDYTKLATLVVKYYQSHGYLGLELFDYFRLALGTQGLIEVEYILGNDNEALFYIIALQNNADKLITAIKEKKLFSAKYILKLANLLIDDLRSDEAIDWLIKYVPDNIADERLYISRQELLIKALNAEGEIEKAKHESWHTFSRTLSSKHYLNFLKSITVSERQDYTQKAISLVSKSQTLELAWTFLEDIQEYQELSNLILSNLGGLNQVSVSFIRKLSKSLAASGCFLAATLLRRYLVDNVLAEATSKYYHYAASDLKLACEYGLQVSDWKSFAPMSDYIAKLKATHARKSAFWSQIHFE
ncbi:MAG: DUF6880 family protein [Burkholderiales bacterium]